MPIKKPANRFAGSPIFAFSAFIAESPVQFRLSLPHVEGAGFTIPRTDGEILDIDPEPGQIHRPGGIRFCRIGFGNKIPGM